MDNQVNIVIKKFVEFLNGALPAFNDVQKLLDDKNFSEELRNDFFQANWEILVESMVCVLGKEFLEVYGDGADCNGASSRVCFPDKLPTHRIECITKKLGDTVDEITRASIDLSNHVFHSFVHFKDGNWSYTSPINAILFENDDGNSVVKIENIDFEKSKIKNAVV